MLALRKGDGDKRQRATWGTPGWLGGQAVKEVALQEARVEEGCVALGDVQEFVV